MKILYFTDTHDMGRNPGARIDDYHTAIMKKFKEAVNTAIKEGVDAVVHGGDWWHYPKVANSIYNQHQRLLRKLRKKKIKVYVVPGNHDVYGYSISTLDQTSIGSLAEAGLVKLLTRDKNYTLNNGNVIVGLYGREYSIDIDQDPLKDYNINPSPSADIHFLFSHGMLLDKPFHPDVRHTLTKDVTTKADYVFNGHYHPGWKAHEENGTWFYNIGSTGRDEGSVDSVSRIPQYAIIDIHRKSKNKAAVDVDIRKYKCAEKGDKVFDRTQLIQKKQHERYLESFEQTLQDALVYESFDPKDILSKATGLPKKVIQDAFDAISDQEKKQADNKLDGYIVKKHPISIKELIIENVQSHKKTRMVFDEKGLNVLTGPSDSGKSAAIRTLRWVLYNDPKGTDFIRHGASRASGTVVLSDGSSIKRTRTRSSAGEYIITDKNGKETVFKGFGNHLPIEIANTHQMPKVELSPGLERSINFAYQLDGHFLLSESPATRAATIGRLTGVHLVDGAVKEVAKEIRKVTVDSNAAEKRIAKLDEQIAAFSDLPKRRKQIDLIKALFLKAESMEATVEELSGLNTSFRSAKKQVRSLRDELDCYADIDKGLLTIQLLEEKIKEINDLNAVHSQFSAQTKAVYEIGKKLADYEDVDKGIAAIEKAKALKEEVAALFSAYKTLHLAEEAEAKIVYQLSQYKEVSKHENLNELDQKLIEIKALKSLSDEYSYYENVCKEIKEDINKQAEKQTKTANQIKELLSEIGTCPTCHQSLDDHVAEEILQHI